MKKMYSILRPILVLTGAGGTIVAAIDHVRTHSADDLRYVEVLPLLIAFSLLLLQVRRPSSKRDDEAGMRKPPGRQ